MQATIQLCTFNRARLLERVLEGCFEQNVGEGVYEVVLVNDGSTDDTLEVIERARETATVPFTVINQENSGLARGRNAGIAAARGERIVFIDDDVLPVPSFVAEHLRSHAEHPRAVVRGAVINAESFDELPPPIYSWRNYSGNFFWTSNVSVPLATLREIGGFNEDFAEYGWEDIDVGLRLRARGLRSILNRYAIAFHFKPPPRTGDVPRMIRQARAQARTAVQLEQIHPLWRARLATGNTVAQRLLHKWIRGVGAARYFDRVLQGAAPEQPLTATKHWFAKRLAADAYFDELERARSRQT
jgi:glycosyltransferase involved in cell wall biosynthesis